MDRFLVLISKRSRFLFETPASIAMRIQTRLARVKPNGKPTQINLPTPMLTVLTIADGSIRTNVLSKLTISNGEGEGWKL